ncbi:MAG: DUF4388 domain-containing protein [Vicinamibacteria bacterium]
MTTAETHSGGEATGRAAGWIGSLAHTPLAEVLQRIVHEGRSGDLQVTIPDAIKTVYFDRGFVVLASSTVNNDRLGESMIEAGRISRHEFALASMVMKASNRKFGETLVQAGIVSEEELGHYVATQVNRIVLSLFSAKTGMYSFDERPCTVPVELMVSLSVYRILLEGVRRMTRKKLVLAGLPPLETRLKIASEPPFSLDVAQLRPVEKDVLRVAGEGTSIARIAKTLGGEEGVVLRAAYGLSCAGVLEAIALEKPSRRLRVQEETGTFVLSEIRRKVEPKKEASPPAPTPLPVEEPVVELVLEPTIEPGIHPAPPTPMAPSQPEERPSDFEPSLAPPVATQRRAHPPPPSSGSRSFESVRSPWLRRILEALWPLVDRIERALLRWVGSHAAEVETLDLAPPAPAEPPKDRPEAASSMAVADEGDGEKVGVPSWSILSIPEEPTESAAISEPPEEELESAGRGKIEGVGVPSWSMKDDPAEPVLEIESSPEAWSFEEAPGGAAEDVAPLSSLDNELFIEGELSGDDAPSMLSHIPVEEIDVDVDIDVDVEFELDAEPFAGLAEDVEAAAFVPEEPEPSKAVVPVGPGIEDAPVRPHTARPALSEASSSTPPISSPVSEPALESADAPLPSEDPLASRAGAMLRAKQGGGEARLLRDVRLHFKLQDWEGVVPLLEQLVQISPGSALYRGMLARAMSRLPMMRKDAEEHFIEALRLAPHDAELHYWLGLYYKSFGLKSRAYTEFRTTLRIDPRHEGARSQLAGGRKDDAIGTVFKKLFG